MFYRPEDGHGLPHNPFSAIVSPRPIGWISTKGADGAENLAPYSFFNAVAYTPPQVVFASTGRKPDRDGTKDSVANIRETGVFCCNIVARALAESMNQSSGPWDRSTDEFALTGLDRAPCESIDCSRVAAAPANLECRLIRIIDLAGEFEPSCPGRGHRNTHSRRHAEGRSVRRPELQSRVPARLPRLCGDHRTLPDDPPQRVTGRLRTSATGGGGPAGAVRVALPSQARDRT